VDPAKTQDWLDEQISELRQARAEMGGDEKARIKALPYANLCIEDKQAEERVR